MRRHALRCGDTDVPMSARISSGASIALALLLLAPATVAAQSASEQSLAREQFRAGVAAARGQEWDAAVDAFQRSYELSPRPMTMMNLAGALAQSGRLVEASEAYRQFLAEAQTGTAARVRDEAQEQLRALEARIPRVRLRVLNRRAGDVVTLDEYQISEAAIDQPLPVDPGEHSVTISREGLESRTVPFTSEEGVLAEVVLEAWPDLGATDPAVVVAPEGDPLAPPPPVTGRSVFEEPAFWIIVGVVVAGGVGVGVGVGVATQSPPPVYFGNLPPSQVPLE
jgi:hypothetical protein